MATPQETFRSPLVGRFCIVSAALLWSTSGAFVKNLPLSPATTAMYRALLAGMFLLFLYREAWPPKFQPAMLGMMIAFALMNYAFIASMTFTTAANTIFLQYTAPFWMTLASVLLLKEQMDRRQFWAMAGSLTGVAVILIGNHATSRGEQWGLALGLASGVFYAAVAVFLRHLRAHDPLWLTTINHLAAFVGLAVGQLLIIGTGRGDLADLVFPSEPSQKALLVMFGVVQMGIPYLLFGIGLRAVSAQEAGILTLVEPLMNPIWTYLMAGEVPSAPTLVGGGILLAALAVRYVPLRRNT